MSLLRFLAQQVHDETLAVLKNKQLDRALQGVNRRRTKMAAKGLVAVKFGTLSPHHSMVNQLEVKQPRGAQGPGTVRVLSLQ